MSSVISIAMVLFLVGAASVVVLNSRRLADFLRENVVMAVLLTQDASESQAEAYQKRISTYPYVRESRVVTKEEGRKELEAMLGEDFLDVFESSPVPLSVELTLKSEYVHPDSLAFITPMLSGFPFVEEVNSQQDLVLKLDENLTKISVVFALLIAVLLFISFALIGNMIRVSVFARRFTIHTMKLVGATMRFIRAPFLRAAAVQALAAAALASGALWLVMRAAKRSFEQLFAVFDAQSLGAAVALIVVCGMLICELSTFFVVGKLVRASKDELYY